ncbi:MAG: SDR family oxidoreductase [Thermoleophilia bacterium]|nr:SDR family oxidoreductase [Thermoleophilia bacterium]
MRILVVGSTGGTGPHILRDAVARGHEVTALDRRPEALDGIKGMVRVASADARDVEAMAEAIAGQDAVIVSVSGGDDKRHQVVATRVVEAMHLAGVRRLVFTSAYGIVATRPLLTAGLTRRRNRDLFADQLAADEVVAASDLDWTIARATRLTEDDSSKPARVETELLARGPWSLGRTAWATALVDFVEQGSHIRETVNVTGG